MKRQFLYYTIIILALHSSCSEQPTSYPKSIEKTVQPSYTQKHLKDLSKDTIIKNGKVIEATDIGWAYTLGLSVDIGDDTLEFNYFSEKESENTILNKEISLSYYYKLKYDPVLPDRTQKNIHKITGLYKILDPGGDLPGSYSITEKNGNSIVIDAFIYEDEKALEGKVITEYYKESYEINITSLKVIEKPLNTSLLGNWNLISTDSIMYGNGTIQIRVTDGEGWSIDFGGGEDPIFVKSDVSSNLIEGKNSGGDFKIELISKKPPLLSYSDDGRGGHFNAIIDQKYNQIIDEYNQFLVGTWRYDDGEKTLEFTDEKMIDDDREDTYVLCNNCMESLYHEASNEKNHFISTFDDENRSLSCIMILKLNETQLEYVYLGTTNHEIYKLTRTK